MIYQPGKYLRVYYEGVGNINYEIPATISAGVLVDANDGLSKDIATGTIAQLGQQVGRAGDPAILLEDREIPNPNGFSVFFGRNNGVDNVVGINSDAGIDISNNTGTGLLYFDGSKNFTIDMPTAATIRIGFGADSLLYDVPTRKFILSSSLQVTGFAAAITPSAAASVTPTRQNFTFIHDTTGGNAIYHLDPAVLADHVINVKKISADVNSITLTPTSGTIQATGAPAASLAFNVQGESITVHCDGTNFYVI